MHKTANDFCRHNPNIIFTRADKGNVTVAMDNDYYKSKVLELLNDPSTYSSQKKSFHIY